MIKRLGVFCTYDSEGVVDDYIIFLLQDMIKNLSHLTIVCNGKLTPEGRQKLEEITADIFVRDNSGFDMEAWRQGILRQNLADYDELILFNDSFYGPFYPFAEVFDKMDTEKPDADFWGMTIHRKGDDPTGLSPYGYTPEHIQSYFLVVRKKLLHSPEFLEYWKNATVAKTFEEAIRQHEICFTKNFFDKGFTYAVYCDTRDWEPEYTVSMNHYIMSVERLLKVYHCPILKKKVVLLPRTEYLKENYGDGPRKSIDFIKNHTNYDVSLIFKNLLRTQNVAAIKETLGLNYIFPANVRLDDTPLNFGEVVIIAHLYYEDLFEECIAYLCNAPKGVDFIVTVDGEQKKILVEKIFKKAGRNCEVRIVEKRGRDLSALFIGCKDVFKKYKYACFIHDKKSLREGMSIANGDAFFHMIFENTLAGENYIKNILSAFENDKYLGLLVPPPPHHGNYRIFIANYWTNTCFAEALKLTKRMNIPDKFLNANLTPLAVGTVFWCRTEVLQKMSESNWKLEDFPAEPMPVDGTISHALERMFPFAAQAEGFYTGWLMTENFARDALENFIHYSTTEKFLTPPGAEAPLTKSQNQLIYEYFLSLTTLQVFKFFLQSRIPPSFWGIFRPLKNLLGKLGFKV